MNNAQNELLLLSSVRILYPVLFVPERYDNKPENIARYGISIIVPKSGEVIDKLLSAVKKSAENFWGSAAANQLELIKNNKHCNCISDGDLKTGMEGVAGSYVLRAIGYSAPQVRDEENAPVTEQPADRFLPGDYCNVLVQINAKKDKAGDALRCKLYGVQFDRKGDRLGDPVSEGSNIDVSQFFTSKQKEDDVPF